MPLTPKIHMVEPESKKALLHALGDACGVIAKLAASRIPAPDFEGGLFLRVHLFSSITCFK